MKLIELSALDAGGYRMVLEATVEETAGMLPRLFGIVDAPVLAKPADESKAAAEPKRARKTAPANDAPAAEPPKQVELPKVTAVPAVESTSEPRANGANGADANPSWGIDAAPEPTTPAGVVVPAELASAKVLSEVVRYFIDQGVTTKDAMLSECLAWKKKAGDAIPVLTRINNLEERIERGGTALGLT